MNRFSLVAALLVSASLPQKLASQITQREYAQRRAAFAARLPESAVAVVLGARAPVQDYMEFNQDPSMLYLTGVLEAGTALVIVKSKSGVTTTLFVQPRDPAAETWTGKRMGLDGASTITGLSTRPSAAFRGLVDSLAGSGAPLYAVGAFLDPSGGELNMSADDQFVAAIKKANPHVQITVGNDRQMKAGEVVVMDIGASYKGYAADVTRTVPVTGTYSPEHRAIYQIVRDAQAAAERLAKPGVAFKTMSDSADAVTASDSKSTTQISGT